MRKIAAEDVFFMQISVKHAEPSAENETERALWEALCQSSETHIQRVIREIESGE